MSFFDLAMLRDYYAHRAQIERAHGCPIKARKFAELANVYALRLGTFGREVSL